MVTGHFATALIARQKISNAPLSLLLISAIALDVIWLVFAFTGFETPEPASWLQASLMNIRAQLVYSHDLVPVIGWTFTFLILGWALTRRFIIGFACAALVFIHWLCDLLVGFQHYITDNTPPPLGLDLYNTHPFLGLVIEAIFGGLCVAWFARARKRQGKPLPKWLLLCMYLFFVGGSLSMAPLAENTLSYWFGLL